MKNKFRKITLALVLALSLSAVMVGCKKEEEIPLTPPVEDEVTPVTVLGEGETKFALNVFDLDGNEEDFEIYTDEETVGAALKKVELIEGEEGAFGIYVKTVNGITADYDEDKTYWAFYIDGEYATVGVDEAVIDETSVYELKVEK